MQSEKKHCRRVEDYIASPKDRMKRLAPIGASVTISTVKDMTISYSAVLELESNYSIDNVKEAFDIKDLLQGSQGQ